MHITISSKAKGYLLKKLNYFNSRQRVARIVLTERSCSGAKFRIFFEPVHISDKEIVIDGASIYLPSELLDEFDGFSLDVEQFFFAPRLVIEPITQSYRCNCEQKCYKSDLSPAHK